MSRSSYRVSTSVGQIHIRLQSDGLWHPEWNSMLAEGYLTPQQAVTALVTGKVRPLAAEFDTSLDALPAELSKWTVVEDRRVLLV